MHSANNLQILLVEDNDIDVMMVKRLMKRLNLVYPIVRASNGEEALRILRPADGTPQLVPPYIILLDINMPRMGGFELLEELGSDAVLSNVPIYMLTTSDSYTDRSRAEQLNVTDYFVKPVTAEQMMQIIGHDDSSISVSEGFDQ